MPLSKMLFSECGGETLDSYKPFTVKYKIGEDLNLGYHFDNAEVTLNVCLGKTFTGGDLYFGDTKQVQYYHRQANSIKVVNYLQ